MDSAHAGEDEGDQERPQSVGSQAGQGCSEDAEFRDPDQVQPDVDDDRSDLGPDVGLMAIHGREVARQRLVDREDRDPRQEYEQGLDRGAIGLTEDERDEPMLSRTAI